MSQISKCPVQDVDSKHMLNFQSGNRLDVKDSFLVFMVWCDLFIWKKKNLCQSYQKQRYFTSANSNQPQMICSKIITYPFFFHYLSKSYLAEWIASEVNTIQYFLSFPVWSYGVLCVLCIFVAVFPMFPLTLVWW